MIINDNKFNNLIYLTEQESYMLNNNLYNIYITESGIIELNKILEFYCNNDSYELEDCISFILESNNIDNFCVSINEEDVILEPSIVNLFENYVIKPISPYNKIYQECVDYTNELISLDEAKIKNSRVNSHNVIDSSISNSDSVLSKIRLLKDKYLHPNLMSDAGVAAFKKMNYLNDDLDPSGRMRKRYNNFLTNLNNKDKKRNNIILGGAAVTGLSAAAIYKLAKKQKSPKSFIGKKIASFRKIYRNLIAQAQKNPQKAGMLKRVAAKILKVIDQLMAKLQNMAG